VTHHGDKHVGEHDDYGDVVEREQEEADPLDNRCSVTAARETMNELTITVLVLVLDLDTVDADEAEHRPEQRIQRSGQSAT